MQLAKLIESTKREDKEFIHNFLSDYGPLSCFLKESEYILWTFSGTALLN